MTSITFNTPTNAATFDVELDDLDADTYAQALALAIWQHAPGAHVSSYCEACDHIGIGEQWEECPECGATDEELIKHADTATPDELSIESGEGIPEKYLTNNQLDDGFFDYQDAVNNSSYDAEVWEAGVELGIDLDNIEEAYAGSYRDDEEFAQEQADDLGSIDESANWPYTCIDWEQAARELMMDYSEQDGHYFRDL